MLRGKDESSGYSEFETDGITVVCGIDGSSTFFYEIKTAHLTSTQLSLNRVVGREVLPAGFQPTHPTPKCMFVDSKKPGEHANSAQKSPSTPGNSNPYLLATRDHRDNHGIGIHVKIIDDPKDCSQLKRLH